MFQATNFVQLAKKCIDAERYGMRTHMIAQVIEYETDRNVVSLKPVTMVMRTADPEIDWSEIPVINEVPVLQTGSGKLWLTVAPQVDTYGLCHISDRIIDDWLTTGGIVQPSDLRTHHISDAIFDPSLVFFEIDGDNGKFKEPIKTDRISMRTRTGITEVSVLDNESITIKNEHATITIDPSDGTIEAKIDSGASLKIQNSDSDTEMTVGDGTVSVAIAEALQTYINNTVKVWLDTHTHPTGVGPSGPPPTPITGYDTAITSSKVKIPNN
jgi:hypothetical protein